MSNLVLWGHRMEDYQEMFDLTTQELTGKILEYGSGPSAFNAQMHQIGRECISCDPLFSLDKDTLSAKAGLIFADRVDKMANSTANFDFSDYAHVDELIAQRQAGIGQFFSDYELGKKEQRYLPIQAINLPFADFSFDLALSSHYLFSQLDNQDLAFHHEILLELARVAKEVRVFPLINSKGRVTPLLGPLLLTLQQQNYGVEVRSVKYHLQPSGNALLRVWAQQCRLV